MEGQSFRLGYGVMVTQQILVLFFLVRIRVAQHKKDRFKLDLRRSFHLKTVLNFYKKFVKPDFAPVHIMSIGFFSKPNQNIILCAV